MERRLAAILAADVVGYTRLMGTDEAGTLAALQALRDGLFDPAIEKHHGRIIKLMGDGTLVEFASVVDAVNCAVEVQAALAEHNADVPVGRCIELRIGINLGDMIVDGEDLYGDGVNIAARLESIADTGGILVSQTVVDHARGRVAAEFEEQGERRLKNIDAPVRVWRVTAGEVPAKHALGAWHGRLTRRRAPILAVAASILFAAIIAIWHFAIRPEPVDATGFDREALLAIPEGPALAVLRLENRSGDSEQDWFAEGISLEIIAELGYHPRLRLIGRTSSFGLKEEERNPLKVRELLGADYVLDGYVQRMQDRVRLRAELYDTRTGTVIWSENYDEILTPENLIDVQSLVAQRVAVAVGEPQWGAITLERKRTARNIPPASLSSYDCTLYSAGDWYRPGAVKRMFACSLEVVSREPDYAPAWASLSLCYSADALWSIGVTGLDRPQAIQKAIEAAETAVRLSPKSPEARMRLATAYAINQDREGFWTEAEKFLELGWRSTSSMANLGGRLAYSGKWELGTSIIRKVMELSPYKYPKTLHFVFMAMHFDRREYDKALEELNIAAIPGHWLSEIWYARLYGAMGKKEKARVAVQNVLAKKPGHNLVADSERLRMFLVSDDFIARSEKYLKAAGLPEN